MAYGINFEESNHELGAPKGFTEEEVYTLPICLGLDVELQTNVVISCWQLTPEELEEINNNGGKLYCKIIGGQPAMNIRPHKIPDTEVIPYTREQIQESIKAEQRRQADSLLHLINKGRYNG